MNENSQSLLNNRFGDRSAHSERISLGENDVMIHPSNASSRVVVHSGNNTEDEKLVTGTRIRRRKSKINVKRDIGLKMGFVERVYTMLEDAEREGFEDVVRWEADGRCFKVHNIKEFEDHIQPMYLHQSKLRSFQRKLVAYGFKRVQGGPARGAYGHENFKKGCRSSCAGIDLVADDASSGGSGCMTGSASDNSATINHLNPASSLDVDPDQGKASVVSTPAMSSHFMRAVEESRPSPPSGRRESSGLNKQQRSHTSMPRNIDAVQQRNPLKDQSSVLPASHRSNDSACGNIVHHSQPQPSVAPSLYSPHGRKDGQSIDAITLDDTVAVAFPRLSGGIGDMSFSVTSGNVLWNSNLAAVARQQQVVRATPRAVSGGPITNMSRGGGWLGEIARNKHDGSNPSSFETLPKPQSVGVAFGRLDGGLPRDSHGWQYEGQRGEEPRRDLEEWERNKAMSVANTPMQQHKECSSSSCDDDHLRQVIENFMQNSPTSSPDSDPYAPKPIKDAGPWST